MPRSQRIVPSCLPAHVADNNAYSYGVLDGDTLHVSGMVAFAPDGSYVGEGNITAQATQVFDNLQAVVVEAGGTLEDVRRIAGPALPHTLVNVSRHVLRAGPDVDAMRTVVRDLAAQYRFGGDS